jgi:outer membrane protein assembly factor BamB
VAGGRVFLGGGDGLVYAFEAADGRLLWRAPLDAGVDASVAAADGAVYALSRGDTVTALDAATGDALWETRSRFGFYASPAVGPRRLYAAAEDGTLLTLDRATGATVWEQRLGEFAANFVGSPLLLGNSLLIVDDNGTLHAFDAETGQPLQHLPLNAGDVSASLTWGAGALYLTTGAGQVLTLDAGP